MKSRIWIGVVFVVLGLLVAIGPRTIFPVCEGGMMKMVCAGTAQAALWTGLAIAVLGILFIFLKPAKAGIGLAAALGVGGVLTILWPTALIGVCKMPEMNCHALTLPALVILGSAIILTAAVAVVLITRAAKRS